MTVTVVIGALAALAGMSLGVPQLIKLVRTRNVEGLSLFAWQSTLVINLIWLVHGLRIEQPPQWITNLVALATTVPIVVLLARAHRRPLLGAMWPVLAAAGVIIGIDVLLGSGPYGVAAILPAVGAMGGQTIEFVRAAHVHGVSAVFTVGAFLNQCLWLTFSVLIADPGSIIATSLAFAITAFNLLWYGLRRVGLRPFFQRDPLLEPQPEALG